MKTRIGILAMVLSTLGATAASAQTASLDERWSPWIGCWRLFQDNVREQSDSLDAALEPSTTSTVLPGMVVCVQPAGTSAGVRMTTYAEGRVVLEQTILADGVGHPMAESGCQGTQTSAWSRDGQRLFTHVEVACNGRPKQVVSGITLLARGPAWVDVQAIAVDGDQHVRIRRYEPTIERPDGAGTTAGAQAIDVRPMSLEDVIEASAKVTSQAVEAALVETRSRFTLNSKALRELVDSGVSPNVIDLMVAQSFPTHFRVERPAPVGPPSPIATSVGGTTVIVGSAQYPGPYPGGVYDPYYYNYYYYSPFAYPYYWGNNYYYLSNGNTTVINPNGSGSAAPNTSSPSGQVVNGRGYTRVSTGDATGPATATPAQHTTTGGNNVRSSSGGTGASSGSSSSSSGSGSDGSASGQGYSSGGASSGSDTGRTAQPR